MGVFQSFVLAFQFRQFLFLSSAVIFLCLEFEVLHLQFLLVHLHFLSLVLVSLLQLLHCGYINVFNFWIVLSVHCTVTTTCFETTDTFYSNSKMSNDKSEHEDRRGKGEVFD